MARKITKNSRNARQGLLDVPEPEIRALENLPRAEKTDLTNILIRTAAKNEALLDAKMSKKRSSKNGINKVSKKALEKKIASTVNSMDRERLERALNITNRLDGKVSKSVSRAKFVQTTRKAGWDSINESIKNELALLGGKKLDSKPKGETEDEETELLEELNELPSSSEEGKETASKTPVNLFSLLSADVEE
ncbi:hypothetical protein KAFR_0I00180 [Kazachstania africana CBS 2517]|uniref:Ecm1p n=1 Tax=Kazachstania africana (strain ATCC 22294 / BCRC 22015 / CBS 2517 / CECT 1963 / NBRC 1671 / NRRL Y-8276) TaxID=1071382 RepID=H2AZJ9_KAZAF|nr:hypothetical protein KAFR_0I00180 [Kazachstania africana CBS 2517]CCF59799.1 hypothetical protein KAFR_0I00180 [Kazachstania africana CBS 2517]